VISTPYWHAAELLKDERGILVPFADPPAIAREVRGLLRDEARRNAMSSNAYKLGRTMVWSHTAGLYMSSFEAARQQGIEAPRESVAASAFGHRPHESPELNLEHLYHMSDSTGILQHASFTDPNFAEGYCTDDNARALILAVLLGQMEDAPKRIRTLATPSRHSPGISPDTLRCAPSSGTRSKADPAPLVHCCHRHRRTCGRSRSIPTSGCPACAEPITPGFCSSRRFSAGTRGNRATEEFG